MRRGPGRRDTQWGFVHGGMGQVTAGMAAAAVEAGATITTAASVAGIRAQSGAVRGVALDAVN